VEFGVPTVVNGKMYVGSVNQVVVYGLLPSDFSLGAMSSAVNVNQGSTVTDTININSLYGFAGSIALSASNLPSGVGVSISFTVNGSGSSSVTFTEKSPFSHGVPEEVERKSGGVACHSAIELGNTVRDQSRRGGDLPL
jgi:hypothetical protein